MAIAITKNIVFLVLLQVTALQAYPYRFTRLMLLDKDKKIEKTVDLISDRHVEIHEKVKRRSRGQKSLLSAEETSIFTTTERSLLSTLRTIHETASEKIDLLWEYVADENNLLPNQSHFIFYGGKQARSIFIPHNSKNQAGLFFKDSDTQRKEAGLGFELLWYKLNHNPEMDLSDFKASVFQQQYSKVAAYVRSTAQDPDNKALALSQELDKKLNAGERLFEAVINKYGDGATLDDLLEYCFATLTSQEIFDFFTPFLEDIANYEFIYNIMNSKTSRSIVYAGGAHCTAVIDYLIKHGYTKIIDINAQPRDTILDIPISHKAWSFLQESAQKSLQRYQAHGKKPFIFDAPQELITAWVSVMQTALGDKPTLKTLQKLVPQIHKGYANLIEARDQNTGESFLFSLVKNNYLTSAAYLLKNQARPNALNNQGETPLFYALYSPEMTALLLHNGANPYLVTKNGRTLLSSRAALPEKNSGGAQKISEHDLKTLLEKTAQEKKTPAPMLDNS